MSNMHEELEVGQHLDQALRSSVTGLAQLMERISRRGAERDRAAAASERDQARNLGQQYREAQTAERDQQRRAEMAARDKVFADKRAMLDERDASRQAYGPWLREGAVERGDRLEASRAWARAAGWVEQDPRARDAEKMLRERITDAYGVSPSEILRSVEPGRGNPTGIPAGRVSLSEAVDLATRYAPHYYGVHTSEPFGRIGKSPINPTQEKFVDDWQRWAATGSLPHDILVREWARHNGHGELLDGARFGTAAEQEAALEKVWRDETVTREEQEYEHHKQQLAAAEMSTGPADEAAGVSVQERPDYRPYLDPEVFANTDPRVAVQAWESARRDTVADPADRIAAAARENLEEQFRRRHHVSPATYLADAVHDIGVTTTDQRRSTDHEREAAAATAGVQAAAQEISTETARQQPGAYVMLHAGKANPDRGMAPSKAGSAEEREHRVAAWDFAEQKWRQAKHGNWGIDGAAAARLSEQWKALPNKEKWDLYWKEYDTERARQVWSENPQAVIDEGRGTPDQEAWLGVETAAEPGDQLKTPTPRQQDAAARQDPASLTTQDTAQLHAIIEKATHETPAAAVVRAEGTDRPVTIINAPFSRDDVSYVETAAGDAVRVDELIAPTEEALGYRPAWVTEEGRWQATDFSRAVYESDGSGVLAAAPATATTDIPRREGPAEDRGVAPRKAQTQEERDHRSRTWQIAERDFRAGLDPALSPAQAGQAWRDLPEKERYERYWAAYDTDEARGVQSAAVAGRPVEESRPSVEARSAVPGPVTRERVLELNEAAAQWYSGNLQPGTPGHEYLTGRLGENAVTNGQWRLGYAPGEWNGLARHLRRETGATDHEIVAAGLGRISSRNNVIDAFRNRAMAAITDTDGSVVGFYGRDLTGEDRNPKHLNTGATPAYTKGEHVFGLHEAAPGARLARAEATFDAIAITEASDGQLQGVAPLGTALTDAQADKIAGKIGSDGRVWLALDSDAAGQRQVATDFWKFTERGVDVRELGFPAGADPAQMWQEQPDVMRGLVAYPDVARSASMAVMDATIAEERVGLLTGDEAARERVDLAEGELASVLRNDFDRGDLNAHVRSELDRLRGQEVQALEQAEHLDQREDQLHDRAVQSLDPNQREQLEGRAERLDDAEQAQRGRAAQLHGQEVAAQGHTADIDDAADMPYNRAASSDLAQVSPGAARARAVSAHGFSQSTQDALDTGRTAGKQWQPKRTTGTQQQVGRSRGMRR